MRSKISFFSVLHDSTESIIGTSWIVIISVKASDFFEFAGNILRSHVVGVEETSLNHTKNTSVRCHLSLDTKPPPTSKTLPVSLQL